MAQINAYLAFRGNCREAMEFYKSCLGGELTIHTFENMPGNENMPEEARKGVMHASLQKDSLALMASDSGMGPITNGNSISLSLICTSSEEITVFYNRLSEGGNITMPLGEQFWGATFGMFTDKFGMPWMLNYEHTPQK